MTMLTHAMRRGTGPIASAVARQDVRPGESQRVGIESRALTRKWFWFELKGGKVGVEFDGYEPSWLYPILKQIKSLDQLPPDWDSYGGAALTFEAALASLDFLTRYLPEPAVEPSIVPSSTGGLQLEWHRNAGDMEVTFSPDGSFTAFFSDAKSGAEWDMAAGEINASRLEAAVTAG